MWAIKASQRRNLIGGTSTVNFVVPARFGPGLSGEELIKHVVMKFEGEFHDLPEKQQAEIVAAGASAGFDLNAIRSLRRLYQRASSPHRQRRLASEIELKSFATEFEDAVLSVFLSRGVDAVTSSMLEAEATSKYRRPRQLTRGRSIPDAIFQSPVTINGAPVKWVEFKSFYGAASLVKAPHIGGLYSLPRQVCSHVDQYGPGAVIFLRGLSSDLPWVLQPYLPPYNLVQFLDARSLDSAIIERMDEAEKRRCAARATPQCTQPPVIEATLVKEHVTPPLVISDARG